MTHQGGSGRSSAWQARGSVSRFPTSPSLNSAINSHTDDSIATYSTWLSSRPRNSFFLEAQTLPSKADITSVIEASDSARAFSDAAKRRPRSMCAPSSLSPSLPTSMINYKAPHSAWPISEWTRSATCRRRLALRQKWRRHQDLPRSIKVAGSRPALLPSESLPIHDLYDRRDRRDGHPPHLTAPSRDEGSWRIVLRPRRGQARMAPIRSTMI